ncbi:hypothetical protein IJI76_01220 [Candidatus Saccharibacteria bacterium]|nr:hypothetical protein [Candidatus Saccharibacteria bacterium]
MKIGKTISAKREKTISESERMELRKKEEKRKKTSVVVFFMALILIVVLIFGFIMNAVSEKKKNEVMPTPGKEYNPTVEIIDEGGSGYVTDKIKTYVGKIERDLNDLGYKLIRAIIPAAKTREIDVYIEGRNEYYKCHLDRDTAETAEDVGRMVNYLDSKEIKPTYVDVRLSGRAYYK